MWTRQPLARIWYTARAGAKRGGGKEGEGLQKRKTKGFPICKIWASCFEAWSFQATLHLFSSPSTKWWCIGRSWSWSRSGHGDR